MKYIDNRFEIGEECWTYRRKNVNVECPVCKGTKKIMYNGYEIPCKQCYQTGMIDAGFSVVEPCKVKIGRINVSIWETHTTIKYKVHPFDCSINVRNRNEESLFKTQEDVENVCQKINQGNLAANF